MKGTILLNGWSFVGARKLAPGLYSSRYANAKVGWTAEETFKGPRNQRLGLLVRDATGSTVGLVTHAADLP